MIIQCELSLSGYPIGKRVVDFEHHYLFEVVSYLCVFLKVEVDCHEKVVDV
jgi:hypothetical protein